ncbi:MAG: indole-3-glycerol phosphate synthase TrpC [Chitinophagaceae bacterium]
MNILDTIIAYKKEEIKKRKLQTTVTALEGRPLFARKTLSLKDSLLNKNRTGIIAEFKRKSPSKGDIHAGADVVAITKAYTANGASGLSVLTDEHFFGGSDEDLQKARINDIPLLRKEFIVDEYQLTEAKSIGADAILLIAACLTPTEVKQLAGFANKLGLEVLLELHAEEELEHICDEVQLIGINNRNLKTFEVDIERSLAMAARVPDDKIKIAESGIHSVADIILFKEHGFKGFLIGETFMKAADPGMAFADFVKKISASV